MRFNKSELATLASNPKVKFDKEGLLFITEREEGLFRRADVNYERWCKLFGNLLFYHKNSSRYSPPAGVLVLENCRPLIKNEEPDLDGYYVFILEFEGSYPQRISTHTAKERLDWVKCIQLASYSYLNRQIKYLESEIAAKMGNRIERTDPFGESAAAYMEHDVTNAASLSGTTNLPIAKVEEGDLIQF